MNYYSIAIDGPAGSGKSSVAKEVASRLGFTYVDTGAMYRAITLKALQLNINDLSLESNYDFLKDTELKFINNLMYMDGVDVSKEIREPIIVKNVSVVCSLKVVREDLVERQRKMALTDNIIMDGRDIGTNVLPNATVKFYLDGTVDVRARRRYNEQIQKGINMTFEETKADLIRRDTVDSTRKLNPLKKADDAIYIETSDMTVKENADIIINLFEEIKHE